jgi:hypothetical protein
LKKKTMMTMMSRKNKGTLLIDATCAPADIRYPTDLSLLNEAREKDRKDYRHPLLTAKRVRLRNRAPTGKKPANAIWPSANKGK